MQSAWKVGLFVIAFGVLTIIGFRLVGDNLFKKEFDTYFATCPNAGGVQSGAVVSMAGVKVGRVTEVRLVGPSEARMKLEINKGLFIPSDAELVIPTNLFSLGEQQVNLVSPSGGKVGKLALNSTIPGRLGSFLENTLPEGKETIALLNQNLEALRKLLEDHQLRDKLASVLDSTDGAVKELAGLIQQGRSLVGANRALIEQALKNANLAVEDLRTGIRQATAILADPAIAEDAKSILASLQQTAARADNLVGELQAFLADPSLRQSVHESMQNIEAMSRTGTEIAENARKITENGSIVSEKAIELADEAKQVASEARDLLQRLKEVIGRLPDDIKVASPKVDLEAGYNTTTDRVQIDANFRYPLGKTTSLFGGVYDLTETNRITLQYSHDHGDHSFRYGIYASKAGVGVDWSPSSWMSVSGDLFDPNDPAFNVRARFRLTKDAYLWAGVHRLFDRNQPIAGIGIRR